MSGPMVPAPTTPMRLGMALLQSGAKNKAKAVQVLRAVKGTDGTADLGRLWALYANTQG